MSVASKIAAHWDRNSFGVLSAVLALVASTANYVQTRNENAAFAETLAVLGVAADTATLKHDDQDRIIQGIIDSGAASSLARVDLLAAEVEHGAEERERIDREGVEARAVLAGNGGDVLWIANANKSDVRAMKRVLDLLLNIQGLPSMNENKKEP